MKKRLPTIILMTLFAWGFPKGLAWYRQFTEKHYVPYLNYWKLDGISSEFYPMAYVIFHHKEDWDSYLDIPACEEYIIPSSTIPFNFKSYSYIIVYGAKIKSIHWSKKETMFDEPDYVYYSLRDKNLEWAIVEYEEPDSCVYIYQIEHNERLSNIVSP